MRKIYIIPNLFTSLNIFCGIFAIIYAIDGYTIYAAIAILVAMAFDFCDGIIARLQKVSSNFGIEYDSLADLISFGVAPIVLMYKIELSEFGTGGRIGLGIAFLYTVCCALRLARYNLQANKTEKASFTGLPTPAAGGFIASYVLLSSEFPAIEKYAGVMLVFMLVLAYLMISTIRYPSTSEIRIFGKKPFVYLVVTILAVGGAIFFVEISLFLCFFAYILFGVGRKLYYAAAKKPIPEPEFSITEKKTKRKKRRPFRRKISQDNL